MNDTNLNYRWARLNMAEKLIAANVLLFLVFGLLEVFGGLNWKQYLILPGGLMDFGMQPWSLVTYSFVHAGIWHILFNMLWLHFAGRTILNLFDTYRFLSVYFLGVIMGGLLYLAGYNLFPGLLGSGLQGSSAGVMAALIFICSYIPNQEIRIFFFNVKLWQVGVFFVLFDLMNIAGGGTNIGGRLAHLGGAAIGFTYGRQLLAGNDIAAGFTRFIEQLFSAFQGGGRRSPLRTVHKKSRGKKGASTPSNSSAEVQKRIDEILDKISQSGYDSLTQEEKDFLFQAGKDGK